MTHQTSNGSYILIRPIELFGKIWKGHAYYPNQSKSINMGDTVFYLDRDSTVSKLPPEMINISIAPFPTIIHIVLYYHILLHSPCIKEEGNDIWGDIF